MHIVALNHVYWPDTAATAQLLTELCESLAADGHAVRVLARAEPGAPDVETRHGVAVERLRGSRLGKRRIWHRVVDYASFHARAAARLAALRPRPDVVLALTTPPFIAAAAQLALALRGVPVVSVVQDLYPDVAFAAGLGSPDAVAGRALRLAAATSLRHSAAVVTLSEAMREAVLAYGVPSSRVRVIPNWALAELEAFDGVASPPTTDADGPFRVMYSGNLGVGHQFDTVLAAAARLAGRPVRFLFVGDGAARPGVEREVAALGLTNVVFAPLVAREEVAASLASADAHLVTMRDAMAGLLEPSKLYGILATGRPFAYVGPPRTEADLAAGASGAGTSLRHGDVDGLVGWITAQMEAPDRGRAVGARGQGWLRACRTRSSAVAAYSDLLAEVVRRAR
jgi:colanic acid biosynthesis glycosyl transferase WcaI